MKSSGGHNSALYHSSFFSWYCNLLVRRAYAVVITRCVCAKLMQCRRRQLVRLVADRMRVLINNSSSWGTELATGAGVHRCHLQRRQRRVYRRPRCCSYGRRTCMQPASMTSATSIHLCCTMLCHCQHLENWCNVCITANRRYFLDSCTNVVETCAWL